MAFTISDKGEPQNDIQSILFQEDLDILVAGIQRIDFVVFGCAVTAQGSPDMTVAVAKGGVISNGTLFAVTAGNATITAADATNPRIDLVVVNSSGTKAVRAGTPAAAPKPPVRTANDVVLAMVYVPANDTTISTNQITDKRIICESQVTLKKTTTAVVFNNTAAIQTYFTITLPSGLFLAGKILRVRCGGSFLANSGTPTNTLTIAYGGTTIYADASTAATADADRIGWFLDFNLVAQANNDQALVGGLWFSLLAAKTAPTTGIAGDFVSTHLSTPIVGAALAVDSDAADRTLTVQWTMSVANAANETTMEFGVAELL